MSNDVICIMNTDHQLMISWVKVSVTPAVHFVSLTTGQRYFIHYGYTLYKVYIRREGSCSWFTHVLLSGTHISGLIYYTD